MPGDAALPPLCFVLMPFGRKPDGAGGVIDFDAVYAELIAPSIKRARMDAIRADQEGVGGIIHKPMFERLIMCEYAVADLTTANANVFYELGVRHAMRPQSTVPIYAGASRLPFDVQGLRAVPYSLDGGRPDRVEEDVARLAAALEAARTHATDSPVYQLVDGLEPADISRLKTDVFRDRVQYEEGVKRQLAAARTGGEAGVDEVRAELGDISDSDVGVAIDLLLSYRAVEAWDKMIELTEEMPAPLGRSVLVREQKGLALNRVGRGDEAEQVLLEVIEQRGPSSETYGILGRIYKDRWQQAREGGQDALATGLLAKAIDAYLKGFETDWRDAYPGVNTVTLMEFVEPPDPRQRELLPVVRYSASRRLAGGRPDYWDHATMLELAVLASDESVANTHLGDALAAVREVWEPRTTLNNLKLIRDVRASRSQDVVWMDPILTALEDRATALAT